MEKRSDLFSYHLGHGQANLRFLNPTTVVGGSLMVLRLIPHVGAGFLVGGGVMGARGYYHGKHTVGLLEDHLAHLHQKYQRSGTPPPYEAWFQKVRNLHTALYPTQPSHWENFKQRTVQFARNSTQPQRG